MSEQMDIPAWVDGYCSRFDAVYFDFMGRILDIVLEQEESSIIEP